MLVVRAPRGASYGRGLDGLTEAFLLLDAHAPPAERVDSTPPTRDVEERDMPDPDRQRRVDDEQIAGRLEAEHRS